MVVGTKESDRTRASSQRSCEVQSVIMTPEVVTDELMFINNIKLRTESNALQGVQVLLSIATTMKTCDVTICAVPSLTPQEPLSYSLADRVSARGWGESRVRRAAGVEATQRPQNRQVRM